jgi:flagellar protein FlaG
MSADTFVSALFIITAVVAAGILINAVYPIVWSTASTFSTSAHNTDTRMRTDFKIVKTYASSGVTGGVAKVWMKNIGSASVGWSELNSSDVMIGLTTNFDRATLDLSVWPPNTNKEWAYRLSDSNSNGNWDPGETLEVDAASSLFTSSGKNVLFQFVLPNGVYRAEEFTTS